LLERLLEEELLDELLDECFLVEGVTPLARASACFFND